MMLTVPLPDRSLRTRLSLRLVSLERFIGCWLCDHGLWRVSDLMLRVTR